MRENGDVIGGWGDSSHRPVTYRLPASAYVNAPTGARQRSFSRGPAILALIGIVALAGIIFAITRSSSAGDAIAAPTRIYQAPLEPDPIPAEFDKPGM